MCTYFHLENILYARLKDLLFDGAGDPAPACESLEKQD